MAGLTPQFTPSYSWAPIVSAMYPDILTRTYSVPPIYFNRVSYKRMIVPGTDYVPGSGPVPGTGLPALVLQQPLAAGDPAPTHDLTPGSLQPVPSAPGPQPVPSAPSQQSVPSAPGQQPVPSAPSQQSVPSAPSQQSVPSAPGQQSVPSAPGPQPVPSAPGQQSVPSAPSQQSVPSAPGQQPVPSAPSQQSVPSAPSQQSVPSAPGQQSVPSAPGPQPVPSAPGQQSVPSAPSQQSVPSAPSQQSVPSAPSQQSVPSAPGQQSVPSAPGPQPVPSAPGQQSVPSAPSQQSVPSAPSQQSVPSAPSQQSVPSAPGPQPVPSAPGQQSVPSAPGPQPVPSAPGQQSVPSAPSQQSVPSAPGQQSVPSAPGPQPVPSAPGQQSVPSAPSQQSVPSAPSQQSVPSAPSQQSVPSAPGPQPVPSAPSQQPVPSAPSQQPVPSAPSQQSVPSAPSQQSVPSAPGPQPVPSAPGPQPVPSAPGPQPMPSAPGPQPVPSAPRNLLSMEPLRKLWEGFKQRDKRRQKKPMIPPVLQTDAQDDAAQAQVLRNLEELAKHGKEVMFIISQLNFTEYLNKPGYGAAVSQLPAIPVDPKSKTGKTFEGDLDVLVIHRQYGILIGELKTVGRDPAFRTDAIVSKTVKKALGQLNKAQTVVSHLVSDVASPGLIVKATLFLPFVSTEQLERVLANPQLEKNACSTLGAANAAEAARLCCCSNQLSDPSTWWDVTPAVIENLDTWWKTRMNQSDPMMSDTIYVEVVGRFAGPATSVLVNCTTQPRLEVKTADQAIHELGQQLSTLVLTSEQVSIMQRHSTMPFVFLTGPPGTGKTVMLTLVGLCRLRQGKDAHLVSASEQSRAASSLIKSQLKTTLKSYSTSRSRCGKVFLHHYNLWKKAEKDRAVRELTAIGPDVLLILDELTRLGGPPEYFHDLLSELSGQVKTLSVWAAGIRHRKVTHELFQIPLTTPLRSAPSVLREVQRQITGKGKWSGDVHPYNSTMIHAAADGMLVEWLDHESRGRNGHAGERPEDCFLCGQNVAAVLRRLGVGVPGSNITHNDVFILSWDMTHLRKYVTFDADTTADDCDLVHGVRHDGLAARVIAVRGLDAVRWQREVAEVANAAWNSIVVADIDSVQGMERKVVVVLSDTSNLMLLAASRATTQLVVVD